MEEGLGLEATKTVMAIVLPNVLGTALHLALLAVAGIVEAALLIVARTNVEVGVVPHVLPIVLVAAVAVEENVEIVINKPYDTNSKYPIRMAGRSS